MGKDNRKTDIPFARAYDFLMADRKLSAAEKLVMIQVCRYWPGPCYMSAATIARNCGLDPRYVRKIITGLSQGAKKRKQLGKPPRKRYIARGYVHLKKNGEKWTCRVIKALCFATKEGTSIGPPATPIGPSQRAYRPGREEPESRQSAPIGPPNRTGIEKRRKGNRSGGSPSPAEQAHAPLSDKEHLMQEETASSMEQLKKGFGWGPRKRTPKLSPKEFERRRREQLDRLRTNEAMRTSVVL